MGRQHPRFLLCNSTTGKSKGLFIIHALEPRFICEPEFNEGRVLIDCRVLDMWTDSVTKWSYEVREALNDIYSWWRYSGIHESPDPRDQIISKLSKFEFLQDGRSHYTVEQAREIIRIIFPTKAKNLCHSTSSYGLKHDLESISQLFLHGHLWKYCSNNTLKEAMKLEGFKSKLDSPNSPNEIYNISERELNVIGKITSYNINNFQEARL